MEQRDWELLDKQVWGLRPPRNDGVIVLTVVAMFFAGMILGGPPSSARKRANENRVERRAHCYFTSEWRGADCVAIAGGNEIRVKTGIVEIDTTGGPGFGFEHFKQYDFLRDKEIVLTFDDGPWPERSIVRAIARNLPRASTQGRHAHSISS